LNGLLLIDKPTGPTSHDVVLRVRRALAERRIGHTGTLDPAASGLLPLVVGPSTRLARFLSAADKQYEAEIRLGFATDTGDAQGVPLGQAHTGAWPSQADVEAVLAEFRGSFLQQPPAFSAKKVGGRRSYQSARAARHGAASDRQGPAPVPVTVTRLDLEDLSEGRATVRVDCSAGFYVRALAQAVGERLGVGGHLWSLRRTRSGEWAVTDAVSLDRLEQDVAVAREALIAPARALGTLPGLVLTPAGVRRALHGQDIGPSQTERGAAEWPTMPGPATRLLSPEGELVGVAEPARTPGFLHPSVVLS
jgi:tRNA pseudouridine55 synthase